MDERARAAVACPRALRALWRGELPLRFVFWVLNAAAHLAINAVMTGVDWWLSQIFPDPDEWRGAFDAGALIVVAVYAAYTVIAWVGLWRSAGHYNGPRLWRTLARFSVILSVAWFALALGAWLFPSLALALGASLFVPANG